MNKKIIVYWLLVSWIFMTASLLATDRNTRSFSPTAVLIDGFCFHNRSARAPTVYYCSIRGMREVERRYSDGSGVIAEYKVDRDVVWRIFLLASSPSNRVDKGRVNFYIGFSDDATHTVSFPLSKDILGKIVSCLPENVRYRVAMMYKHG